MIGQGRRTDRAEVDRVELAKCRDPVLGHQPTGLEVPRRSPVEEQRLELEPAISARSGLEDAEPCGHDLVSDSIARNDRNAMPPHRGGAWPHQSSASSA